MGIYSQLLIAILTFFWLFTDSSDTFNDVDLIFEYSMNIFKYRWKIFVCSIVIEFCRWYMSHVREFGVLVACEKRIHTKCTRTCAWAQTLRGHCYTRWVIVKFDGSTYRWRCIRAHKAITVHIKKPNIFKEMSHVKCNLTYCSLVLKDNRWLFAWKESFKLWKHRLAINLYPFRIRT